MYEEMRRAGTPDYTLTFGNYLGGTPFILSIGVAVTAMVFFSPRMRFSGSFKAPYSACIMQAAGFSNSSSFISPGLLNSITLAFSFSKIPVNQQDSYSKNWVLRFQSS